MIKTALGVIAAVSLMATVPAAAQKTAPGKKMQDKGSVKGTTGASGYAPGHANDTKSGTRSTK